MKPRIGLTIFGKTGCQANLKQKDPGTSAMRNVSDMINRTKTIFRRRKGFTLLEIIIIIVFLGILSKIIIPQVTKASTVEDFQEQALSGILLTLRSQLELYRVEHLDEYPCGDPQNPVSPELFVLRMTSKTNSDHSQNGIFGDYLSQFPFNPFNGLNNVRYGNDPGKNLAGWCFDLETGHIYSDDSGQSPEGTSHSVL